MTARGALYPGPVNEMPRDHRPAKSVRVLLAEDQGMMRGALALLLGLEADIEVVAQVARGDAIVDRALETRPDVALLDIELPGRSGLDAAADLREQCPDCRVLILTTFGRPGYLRRAMEAGAAGFLVKDGPVEDLAEAVRRVLRGETVIDPALAAAALSAGPNPLTTRECDVLKASVDGATVSDIAGTLHLSESTVRNYLSSAIGKTGTRNRMEAMREARQQGWL
ncbi:response regulator transcription factor [Streptomyces aureus]